MKKLMVLVVAMMCCLLVASSAMAQLKYWRELEANAAQSVQNFGETPLAKELEKVTGIKVEWIHTGGTSAAVREAFNLMIASGDLPDIIEYDWKVGFPGGPDKALEEGIIIPLNDVIDKYAPNFKKYLQENPDIDRMIKTDKGQYYVFPFIRKARGLNTTAGIIIRKDWLDELGLNKPETIAEWDQMLMTFKDKKGATAALSMNLDQMRTMFGGAFGFGNNFYHDNNVVKFGQATPGYKALLAKAAEWYKNGILDPNFTKIDRKTQDAQIFEGKTGATYGSGAQGIGRWMVAMKDTDPKFDLTGVRVPGPQKGVIAEYAGRGLTYQGYGSAAITGTSKNVELAAKFLDFGYSEQGHLMYNFGIEGVSYTMEEGKPTYTDAVMKHPVSPSIGMALYQRAQNRGPFEQDIRYLEQYYALPQQQEGWTSWFESNMDAHLIPPIIMTPDENKEYSKIMQDINTYIEEMSTKMVMGVESLDKFDEYLAQMKKMGIDRAIAIQQAALDRYNKR